MRDVIVIDTPGRDDAVARAAILKADTLVTPMNDSFVDLDLIGQVHPENFKVTKPSFYAELIWNSRTQRAKQIGQKRRLGRPAQPPPARRIAQPAPRRRGARRACPARRLPRHPRPWRAGHLPRTVPQGPDPARPPATRRGRHRPHRRAPGIARDGRRARHPRARRGAGESRLIVTASEAKQSMRRPGTTGLLLASLLAMTRQA